MALKKWHIAKSDKELAKELSAECDVEPIVALLASSRGYPDPGELEEFLSDEPMITDPHELIDIDKAAECINNAIENDVLIGVFGDYDCDGVTSVALLCDYLTSRGARNISYIPDRFNEGYGMNNGAVDTLFNKGVGLIITVDNGITAIEEIEYAYTLGMKVVVTDHHIPLTTLPSCEALVDPHRTDCPSSFKEICGAEVAFKLICVLDNKEPEELLSRYYDLLCVAVIGDVMPLKYENRSIVKYALQRMRTSSRIGISALMNVAGISKDSISSGKISFGIVPRINAAGRMGSASKALELLQSDNMLSALEIANELDNENAERQKTERSIFTEASSIIEQNGYQNNRVIVVASENWHRGVVGIVASRITEKYGVPSIVFSIEGDEASGSGRSFSGFSLYKAIASCKEVLNKFGGHDLAAGVSLDTSKIDEFRTKINAYADCLDYVPAEIKLDCRLNPAALTLDIAESIKQLEPFGMGNPTPVFGIMGVTLQRITPLSGGKHLRLLFSKGQSAFQSLLFGTTQEEFCFAEGDILDIAVTLDINLYKEKYNLSIQIKSMRMSGTDDEVLFEDFVNYRNYLSGKDYNYKSLLPTRIEVGEVYKYILSKKVSSERVKYYFMNNIGYAKTMISLHTLTELGLISNENNILSVTSSHTRTDLMNSTTFSTLTERSEHFGS